MNSADEAWVDTILAITTTGNGVPPQRSIGAGGKASFEILQHTLVFDMQYPIVTIKPNTSWLYMAAEAMWILDGSSRLSYCPEITRIQTPYSDNGETLSGAYGPAFLKQKNYILKTLNNDRFTRQAVMTIWKREPKPSKDIPCTTSLQFIIRNDLLHVLVTMRSSDVGKGLPYDMFSFACMAAKIASLLDDPVELGSCYITAGSRHIYEDTMTSLSDLAHEKTGYNIPRDYAPWATWKWPAIEETLKAINAMPYEDRALAQVQAKSIILNASGVME